MRAARRKGKWLGGLPVLGYDVAPEGGRLVVNEDEAEQVREIFGLYTRHRSLAAVVEELGRRGCSSPKFHPSMNIKPPRVRIGGAGHPAQLSR